MSTEKRKKERADRATQEKVAISLTGHPVDYLGGWRDDGTGFPGGVHLNYWNDVTGEELTEWLGHDPVAGVDCPTKRQVIVAARFYYKK